MNVKWRFGNHWSFPGPRRDRCCLWVEWQGSRNIFARPFAQRYALLTHFLPWSYTSSGKWKCVTMFSDALVEVKHMYSHLLIVELLKAYFYGSFSCIAAFLISTLLCILPIHIYLNETRTNKHHCESSICFHPQPHPTPLQRKRRKISRAESLRPGTNSSTTQSSKTQTQHLPYRPWNTF